MDLLNKQTVREVIAEIESSQNKTRREDEIKAFEVYAGDLKKHVKSRIMELYPKTYKSFSVSDLNVSRKITDKMSKAYKTAPLRVLANDKETQDYDQKMKDMDANRAWQVFDVYYNLHRYACMWFNYVNCGDEVKLVLRPLNPSQFSRVVDSLGQTKVFAVNFPDSSLFTGNDSDGTKSKIQDSLQDSADGSKRYALWSDSQHVIVWTNPSVEDCEIYYEPIEGNEESKNELGTIPAVFAQQGDNTALPIRNPLTNQSIEYNQQYSVMLTGASLQTFGHLILSHPEDQDAPSDIYNSLFTYSTLPQRNGDTPTTLDYLNPNPNLDSQLQVLQNYGHQIITEHLGDGAQNVSGSDNFTSGLDRMIAMSDITNIIESNQQIYANVENNLFQIIKAYGASSESINYTTENLVVKYPKAKPIQSEAEILANIEKKMSLGLIEDFEALMMLDPNMTTKDAKRKIDTVRKDKANKVNKFLGVDSSADKKE